MWIYIWLGIIVLSLAVEAMTPQLVSLWFALGGLCSMILATVLPEDMLIQSLVFVVVSGLSLLLLRPLVKKSMETRRTATNADRVVGMIGLVVEAIDNITALGVVQVGGKTWTARSETDAPIAKGARVEVLRIDGVKLIVTEHAQG